MNNKQIKQYNNAHKIITEAHVQSLCLFFMKVLAEYNTVPCFKYLQGFSCSFYFLGMIAMYTIHCTVYIVQCVICIVGADSCNCSSHLHSPTIVGLCNEQKK